MTQLIFFQINAAAEYANLPFIQPYLQPGLDDYTYGVNFASGGSGALAETNERLVCDLALNLPCQNLICSQHQNLY